MHLSDWECHRDFFNGIDSDTLEIISQPSIFIILYVLK